MKILIIEDDVSTASFLVKGFKENGFTAETVSDGSAGLQELLDNEYACAVLDVLLPSMDGWSVLAAARAAGVETPVIMLTARDSVNDKVKGLGLGADDYVVKPFSFSELLARVRALLRRQTTVVSSTDQPLHVDNLTLDPLRHHVLRGGKRIELTPKEFSLLWLFMRREGDVLSRTFISEQVWDINFDSGTNVVDVAIRRLRAKVDDGFDVKLIHTVRGVGYVLCKY